MNVRDLVPPADWDDAYDNSGHIPGAAAYPPRWEAAAAAFRAGLGARAECDIPYGGGARQRLDLFRPEGEARGLLVFVHGGYWKARARADWSHLAAGALARGWAVAMPGYTLCPAATLPDIRREILRALAVAAARVAGPVVLAGHSAGGQLVTRILCDDQDLPEAGRILRAVSISGLHDLRPLLATAMAPVLRLDRETAAAESPALRVPRPGIPVTAWVGAAERPEILRQAALLALAWAGLGAAMRHVEMAGEHHFSVIEGLADPNGALLMEALGSAERIAVAAALPPPAARGASPAEAAALARKWRRRRAGPPSRPGRRGLFPVRQPRR